MEQSNQEQRVARFIYSGFRDQFRAKSGEIYSTVSGFQILYAKSGRKYIADKAYFVSRVPESVKTLHFGDVVECAWLPSSDPKRTFELGEVIRVIQSSPYVDETGDYRI